VQMEGTQLDDIEEVDEGAGRSSAGNSDRRSEGSGGAGGGAQRSVEREIR